MKTFGFHEPHKNFKFLIGDRLMVLKRIIGQLDVFRKYKGIKPAQTSAATIISNSKSLMRRVLELKRLEIQLRKQIQDYKDRINEFRGMAVPGPGTEKHGEAKKHEIRYYSRRRYLLSLLILITNTIKNLSKKFDETVAMLRDITLDSQVVLFDFEENLNRFFDDYHKEYAKLRRGKEDTAGIKDLADRINRIKEYLISELRVLWQASKAQERRVPSKYTIEELSFMGNIPILRKMKIYAIEVGNLTLRIPELDPMNIGNVEENSKKMIRDNALIQKDAKILFNRLYHLLERTKSSIAVLDKINKKRLTRILNISGRKYNSAMGNITSQSRRLWMDIRIRPVRMQLPKAREIKRRAA